MRIKLVIGSVATLATLLTAAAPAQTRKRATALQTRRTAPKPDPLRLLVGAIALNSVASGEDLQAACARSDFKTLAWALEGVRSRVAIAKGEYETQAEFDARRGKLEDTLNGQGNIVVCQPLDDNEDAPFTYDAEREVFAGSFDAHQNVWRDVKRTGSYVSRTRMGVRATVKSSVEIEYNVDLSSALGARQPACLKGNYTFGYEAAVPRAEAPLLKARGYLVFTGRLVAPFIASDDSPGEPTLDNPHDVFERDLTVHFSPRSVAIVGPGGSRPWICEITPS